MGGKVKNPDGRGLREERRLFSSPSLTLGVVTVVL